MSGNPANTSSSPSAKITDATIPLTKPIERNGWSFALWLIKWEESIAGSGPSPSCNTRSNTTARASLNMHRNVHNAGRGWAMDEVADRLLVEQESELPVCF